MTKKSPNKWVTWQVGMKCQNCNLCSYRLIKEVVAEGERFLHFYCTKCTCENLKHCDFGDIVEFIKLRKEEQKKNGKSNRKNEVESKE